LFQTEKGYSFCSENQVLSPFWQVFLSKIRFSAGLEQIWRDKPVFQTGPDFLQHPAASSILPTLSLSLSLSSSLHDDKHELKETNLLADL
jgi:hypothetical protein